MAIKLDDSLPKSKGRGITAVSLTLLALLIFSLAYLSPLSYTNSDSRYSLLLSQAILQHGTIRLDPYYEQIKETLPGGEDYRLTQINEHIYYGYPLGSSFLSVPFVALFNSVGLDMVSLDDEGDAGNFLSAVIVTALFFIIYKISLYYASPKLSIFVAAIAVLGTTFISTLGTALWNLDFAVLFICLSLWQLIRLEKESFAPTTAPFLGVFLFLAYICRPTTAVFIALTLLFLFIRRRQQFLATAFTAFALLLLFSFFSLKEFDLWLPKYYLPRQLGGMQNYSEQDVTPLPIALYGLLFSPSRGLFLYSPILLIPTLAIFPYWKTLKRQPLFWFMLVWFIGGLLTIARFKNWWGGYSFGPRLLTDFLPAFLLLTLLLINAAGKDERRFKPGFIVVIWLLATVSIFIHSYIGLFKQEVVLSYGHNPPPTVDVAPYLLLDWRYGQLWTDIDSACLRNQRYYEDMLDEARVALKPYTFGQEIVFTAATAVAAAPSRPWRPLPQPTESPADEPQPGILYAYHSFLPIIPAAPEENVIDAVFMGWLLPAQNGIWSTCQKADIVIGSAPPTSATKRLTLAISGSSYEQQPANIYVNGDLLGVMNFSANEAEVLQLPVPASLLHTDQYNRISLEFSHDLPVQEDLLMRGVFLQKMVILP